MNDPLKWMKMNAKADILVEQMHFLHMSTPPHVWRADKKREQQKIEFMSIEIESHAQLHLVCIN